MSERVPLFRQQALAHADDPEALDVLPLLPRRIDWIAFVLLAAIVCAVAAWSVFGTVTRTVSGNGILIAQGGQLVDAQSSGPGQIVALSVLPGTQVDAGMTIATVVAADREQRLAGARTLVEERRLNLRRVRDSIDQTAAQRDAAADLQRDALNSKLAVVRERIGTAGAQFDIQDGLFRRGLATLQRVNDARDAVNAARLDEANTLTALADLKAKLVDSARTDADRLNQAQDEVAAAERSAAQLEVELGLSSRVLAPVPGRVVEVKANLGAMVNAGQAIVSIETGRPGLELLAFIPAQSARDVRPGMPVRISPAGTRREEHGELLGTVLDVSSFPMSATGLRSLLQNETLAETLSHAGAPYVARVALTERPGQPGGYAWTTRHGETVALSSGGLATIEVTASQHRPLELVLPAVRKIFGM
jgi:HlyD family secretion protein